MTSPSRGLVLVSGASSGIGLASALDLARRGFTVAAGYRRVEGRAAIEAAGLPHVVPVGLDVTDDRSVHDAVASIEALAGPAGLAGLVHSAGISELGPLETQPLDVLRRTLDVNVVGAVRLTRACLPALRRARGRIVVVGSVAGLSALPFMGAYSASKAALEAVADAWRVELAPWGIEVAMLEPGSIDTPITGKALASLEQSAGEPGDGPGMPGLDAAYGAAVDAFRRAVVSTAARGLPVTRTSAAIAHALTARRPRTRYLVGAEAWQRLLLKRLLPDRWHDLAVGLVVGLPGRNRARRLPDAASAARHVPSTGEPPATR